MTPTRRQFLVTLFGSSIAAAVVPKLEAFAPGYADAPIAVHLSGGDTVFDQVTAEAAWKLFVDIADQRRFQFEIIADREYRVGEQLPSGMAFRHMFGVDFDFERPCLLNSAMESAVEHAQLSGVGVFAPLPLPKCVRVAERCEGVRYVSAWDPIQAQFINRLDFLGAATETNLRDSNRIRGERTKSRLMAERAERAHFREGMRATPLGVNRKAFFA